MPSVYDGNTLGKRAWRSFKWNRKDSDSRASLGNKELAEELKKKQVHRWMMFRLMRLDM